MKHTFQRFGAYNDNNKTILSSVTRGSVEPRLEWPWVQPYKGKILSWSSLLSAWLGSCLLKKIIKKKKKRINNG